MIKKSYPALLISLLGALSLAGPAQAQLALKDKPSAFPAQITLTPPAIAAYPDVTKSASFMQLAAEVKALQTRSKKTKTVRQRYRSRCRVPLMRRGKPVRRGGKIVYTKRTKPCIRTRSVRVLDRMTKPQYQARKQHLIALYQTAIAGPGARVTADRATIDQWVKDQHKVDRVGSGAWWQALLERRQAAWASYITTRYRGGLPNYLNGGWRDESGIVYVITMYPGHIGWGKERKLKDDADQAVSRCLARKPNCSGAPLDGARNKVVSDRRRCDRLYKARIAQIQAIPVKKRSKADQLLLSQLVRTNAACIHSAQGQMSNRTVLSRFAGDWYNKGKATLETQLQAEIAASAKIKKNVQAWMWVGFLAKKNTANTNLANYRKWSNFHTYGWYRNGRIHLARVAPPL